MSRLFSRISRVAVTGSTNDDVARILGEPQARGLVRVADFQQHGSGRKGRVWIAPPGTALLCTIALPDALPAGDLWIVPFWTALVVHDALQSIGATVLVQWPNDVLLRARKLAGILCLSRVIGDYAWAACGLGVNVTRPQASAELASLDSPPAFLSDAVPVDRDRVLDAILQHADARYDELAFPQRIAREWERAADIPGMPYRIVPDERSEPFDATALRLLPGGALLVESDGVQREVSLADARVLR